MIKNIAIVSQYFAPAWGYGGPPKALLSLARQLIEQGKNIKVITTDVLDEKRNTALSETLDGIEIIRYKTVSNYLAYKRKMIIAPNALEDSKKIIQQSDFVLFSDVRAIINWQLYSFVSSLKIPYGIFAFGEIPHGEGLKAQLKKIMDFFWVKDFVKKATYRFAQTAHEQKMFFDYFGIPISSTLLLPLPVELNRQKADNTLLNNYKKKWGIKESDRIILFVGRLHFFKGVDLLIQAVIPLLKSDPYLKLLIVGRDDGEEEKLRNLVGRQMKNQIIFTGALYEKDIICAYKLASCFVITPRFYEETPLAALEALSYGVPVVVSRQADIPYLEEYQAGYVVHNDPDSIKKAIMQILEKVKKNTILMKKNAQRLIADKFSADRVVQQLLSIIN
ncbi:glycosyltransferase family 4 protein [Candidatus Gottesmanbacteria bacterium]|nr:glycosyltransferase family 4 protein [Candidatus Gottesmanbacteria bacterium]